MNRAGGAQLLAADLFSDDAAACLGRLTLPPPGWPADRPIHHWSGYLAGAVAFARRWDRAARHAGWTALQLYSLHCQAPWHNLAAMGAAFVAGDLAIAVSPEAILMATGTGSRLRIYRRPPDPAAVIAWERATKSRGRQAVSAP